MKISDSDSDSAELDWLDLAGWVAYCFFGRPIICDSGWRRRTGLKEECLSCKNKLEEEDWVEGGMVRCKKPRLGFGVSWWIRVLMGVDWGLWWMWLWGFDGWHLESWFWTELGRRGRRRVLSQGLWGSKTNLEKKRGGGGGRSRQTWVRLDPTRSWPSQLGRVVKPPKWTHYRSYLHCIS